MSYLSSTVFFSFFEVNLSNILIKNYVCDNVTIVRLFVMIYDDFKVFFKF